MIGWVLNSMLHLIEFVVFFGVMVVVFPIATRVVYDRTRPSYTSVVAAYRDALVCGAGIAVFWPVTLPVFFLLYIGSAFARVTAPPEVKRYVAAYNTAAMERTLGMKDQNEIDI